VKKMIDFNDIELEVLLEIIDEEIDNAGKYVNKYKEDKEVMGRYKILLKIQNKIEKERMDVWRNV